jgi:hypothetical protein
LPPQNLKKLLDSRFFLDGNLATATKQSRVKFFPQQSILKALHGPIKDGDDCSWGMSASIYFHTSVMAFAPALLPKCASPYMSSMVRRIL